MAKDRDLQLIRKAMYPVMHPQGPVSLLRACPRRVKLARQAVDTDGWSAVFDQGEQPCHLEDIEKQPRMERMYMKRIAHYAAIPALGTLLFTGCCSTDHVAKPSSITVVQALTDVGTGLAALKAAELQALTNPVFKGQTNFITGLFPAEVDVTFNVTASASKSNSLVIDVNAGPFPQIPVSGKIGDTFTSQSAASRGNQITLKFVSALFAKTTTTTSTNGTKVVVDEGIVDAAKLSDFLDVVKQSRINQSIENPRAQ